MLKRSPRSKISTITISIAILIAIYIGLDSLLAFRALANSHGQRKQYLVAKTKLTSGSSIDKTDLEIKELFSNDAPIGAIDAKQIDRIYFAKLTIPKGTFLTEAMISNSAINTIDRDNRIMFVPSKDKLDSSIGTFADLLYVSPDGYGSEIIAYQAKILFDIGDSKEDGFSEETNPGYFVEITNEEAQNLTTALASGEVRFALLRN
jgi:Flp pilus assembly protein CpaB